MQEINPNKISSTLPLCAPKVSVIVPVYNVEPYIKECLDSLFTQTYPNIELLLVDDGSTDASGEICDEYAEKYAGKEIEIKVFHKKNGGLSSARNLGLDHATGEYIAFVDSDDKCDKNWLTSVVGAAIENEADITFYSSILWYGSILRQRKPSPVGSTVISKNTFLLAQLSQGKWSGSGPSGGYIPLKLFKASILSGLRFVSERECIEDELFSVSACLRAKKIFCLDKAFYYYRQRSDSLVRSPLIDIRLLRGRIRIFSLAKLIGMEQVCLSVIFKQLPKIKNCLSLLRPSDLLDIKPFMKEILPYTKKHKSSADAFFVWLLMQPLSVIKLYASLQRLFK